jgi:hypothetical protein
MCTRILDRTDKLMKVILGACNYLSSRLPVYIIMHTAASIDNRQENVAIEKNTSYCPINK